MSQDPPIHSIDDLARSSERQIQAAVGALRIRERINAGLQKMARETGLTMEEYLKELEAIEAEQVPCRHCKGTGVGKRPKPRTIGVIHPSSADKCALRLYYDVTGEFAPQANFKPPLMVTFKIGHAVHDLLQEILGKDLGAAFEPEKRIALGTLVAGNTDGLITLPSVRAVLEIKTMGASDFPSLKEPKGEHRIQAGGLYATALDAPFVVYIYISKDWPYDIKEYVEVYDPSVFRRWARNKGSRVQAALEGAEHIVADASPAECAECTYSQNCPQRLDRKGGKAFAVARS